VLLQIQHVFAFLFFASLYTYYLQKIFHYFEDKVSAHELDDKLV